MACHCSAPSHYLNQCLLIEYWNSKEKFWCNLYQCKEIFMQKITFENVCKMAGTLFQPQYVNTLRLSIVTFCKISIATVWIHPNSKKSTIHMILIVAWHMNHRSRSTLTKVMAYCLMTPSHYLNQCQLIVSKVLPCGIHLGPLLLTWFNFNPSMDK